MNTGWLKVIVPLIIFSISNVSCEKDETGDTASKWSEQIRTTVSGLIVDENNNPVNNACITIYNRNGYTNGYGIFTIKDVTVPGERCLIRITGNSYFDDVTAVHPVKGGVTYLKKILIKSSINTLIPSSGTQTLQLNGGISIQLPANGYVDKDGNPHTGSIRIKGKFLNPAADNFSLMIPGEVTYRPKTLMVTRHHYILLGWRKYS